MKARIPQKELAAAARSAGQRVASTPLVPALGGLLIDASDDNVTVSGFDMETATTQTAPADIAEPGRIVAPGRAFADIVGAMPGPDVDLHLDGAELHVASGAARFTLVTVPVADYPALPVMAPASGTVDGSELAAAAAHAVKAVAQPKDAGNLIGLTAVHVEPDGDELKVSATNRYHAVQYRLPWMPTGAPAAPTVFPAKAFAEAARAGQDGEVSLSLPGPTGIAGLRGGRFEAAMRGIDGLLPHLDAAFPAEFAAVASVDADELSAAVKRLALVLEEAHPVLLEFAGDELLLMASEAVHARGVERIEAPMDGPDRFRITFRTSYLLSVLSPLSGCRVQINMVTAQKPAVFHELDNEQPYRALVMPVRREWTSQ